MEITYSNNKGTIVPLYCHGQDDKSDQQVLSEIWNATNLGQVVKAGEFDYSCVDWISAPQEQGAEIKCLGLKQRLPATA